MYKKNPTHEMNELHISLVFVLDKLHKVKILMGMFCSNIPEMLKCITLP